MFHAVGMDSPIICTYMHACAMQTINYDSIDDEKDSMKISVDAATGVDGNRDAVDVPVAEEPDKVSLSIGYEYRWM